MLFITYKLRYLALALVGGALIGLSGGGPVSATSTAQSETPTPQSTPTPTPRPILLVDPVPDPHQAGVQWFAPTGHTLRGTFLDYWTKYGGLAQFGYPLTEEFVEPGSAESKMVTVTVQYFERNRFERHPENAGTPYEVLLGRLGLDFHPVDPPASPLPAAPAPAQYFTETGHNLSGPFKAYWETHGGLFVHGYPITEQFEEVNPINHKTYTVQYFERSRFEYHPENAGSQYEVLLGLLGRQLSEKEGYPYGWYPLYGHAADFSWIAGHIFSPSPCVGLQCNCPRLLFQYKGTVSKTVELAGPGLIATQQSGELRSDEPIVVFGRYAVRSEIPLFCPMGGDFGARPAGYIADRIQMNPAK